MVIENLNQKVEENNATVVSAKILEFEVINIEFSLASIFTHCIIDHLEIMRLNVMITKNLFW